MTMYLKHTPEPWPRNSPYGILPEESRLAPRDYERARKCVNACAGINPEAVEDMRKALDHCRNVIAEHLRKPGNDLNGFMHGALEVADAALAKAKLP